MIREEEIKKAAFEYADAELIGIIDFKKEATFIAGAKWADAHPRWISVEDELPKENGRYLFYHDKIGVQLAYYYNDLSLDKAVTHWMPLPSVEHLNEKIKKEVKI